MPPMKPANINLPPSTPAALEQAQAFANDYPVEHLFTSLDELAQSPDVDAVYIASPNSLHFPQTRLFLSHKARHLRKAAGIEPAGSRGRR